VLADEINRTSPKVQAAMLEAMAEKQVTVDNVTRPLDDLFFVIATQNPLDLAGTFPLPVAQLDRFLFKIRMTHIERDAELDVLRSIEERRQAPPTPKVSRGEILATRRTIERRVAVHSLVHESLVDIARGLRQDRRVIQGVSTRSLVLALPALRARAMIYGRDYVGAEDLETILPRVFGHRLELSAGSAEADAVISDALRPAIERLARASMART
jgi:MoxR-like ATPase